MPDVAFFLFFFFNDTATTEIYTLSLHDALPILLGPTGDVSIVGAAAGDVGHLIAELLDNALRYSPPESSVSVMVSRAVRSEEHTSELQSQSNLVCRLLLEKKKKTYTEIA